MIRAKAEYFELPKHILSRSDLTPADKLVYMVLFGLKDKSEIWASNDYLAKMTSLSIPTVNRCLKALEKLGLLTRETLQEGLLKKRNIQLIRYDQNDHTNDQNDTEHDQNDTEHDQNDHTEMIKMISTDDQNDQSITKYNNKEENIYTQKKKTPSAGSQESVPKNKTLATGSEHVYLTDEEKEKVTRKFREVFGTDYQQALEFAVSKLDTWLSNNSKELKRANRCDYRRLIDWPLDAAVERMARLSKLANQKKWETASASKT